MPITILNKKYDKCCICGQLLPMDKNINVKNIYWKPYYTILVAHDYCKDLIDKIEQLKEDALNLEWELFNLQHPSNTGE